jgi:hypothetical protein
MRILPILLVLSFLSACAAAPTARSYDTGGAVYAGDDSYVEAEAVAADGPSVGGSSGPVRKPAATTDPRVDYDRKFVKTAWLDLEVDDEDDFEPTISKVQEIAEGLSGYAVEVSSESITAKVPTERLDEALAAITTLAEVTHKNVRVSDVTSRYVDLQIRIANLEKVRARLQELAEQGEDVKAILEVEKELNRVTSQLEQLKGQMRMLGNQVTFATIHVSVDESVTPGPIGWVFYGAYHAIKWLFVWD